MDGRRVICPDYPAFAFLLSRVGQRIGLPLKTYRSRLRLLPVTGRFAGFAGLRFAGAKYVPGDACIVGHTGVGVCPAIAAANRLIDFSAGRLRADFGLIDAGIRQAGNYFFHPASGCGQQYPQGQRQRAVAGKKHGRKHQSGHRCKDAFCTVRRPPRWGYRWAPTHRRAGAYRAPQAEHQVLIMPGDCSFGPVNPPIPPSQTR